MKTTSNFNILKGTILSILLLAIFGAAANVSAQATSRITVTKDFCASIGMQNTCNGIPASFPGSVTFTVQIGTYDTVSGMFTPVSASPDVVVAIAQNANGSTTTGDIFPTGTYVRVCEIVPNTWQSIPRPESSTNGQQFALNNCLIAELGPGNNSLKFINGPGGPTAADVSITGRVVDANGAGIASARLTLVNAATGETKFAVSSLFGYYSFAEVEVGQLYMLNVAHRRYRFAETQRVVSLADSMTDVDFVAMPTKQR